MVRGAAVVVVRDGQPAHIGWLLLGPVGSIWHMRLCARFVLLKMIRTKKLKLVVPRALSRPLSLLTTNY